MIPQIDDQMYLYQFIQRRFVPRKGESHATIATSEMANPKFVSSQVKQLVDDVQVFLFCVPRISRGILAAGLYFDEFWVGEELLTVL